MSTEDVEDAQELLERMVNVFGGKKNVSDLAIKMTRMHRTLVQSFTDAFVITFVKQMSNLKRNECYDGRNQAAVEACDVMYRALEEHYGLKKNDALTLPVI